MPLDDDVRAYLEAQAALNAPAAWEVSLEQARRASRARHLSGEDRTPVGSVDQRSIPGPHASLTVRIYHPGLEGLLPGVVFLHGGGFVLGDLDTHDEACRRLCVGAGAVVVAVDYRRAPEAPFPAAVEDAVAAGYWTARNAAELGVDPSRLVVSGDSAGANLATVVARRLRDEDGPPLAGQLLVYPATDMRENDYPSRRDCAQGYGLSQEAMDWFVRMYLPDRDLLGHPDASPVVVEKLADMPPSFVLTAEYDPLRDEGDGYARRLKEAGVPVEHLRMAGTIHGILTIPESFTSRARAWEQVLAWLQRTVGTA